VIGARVDLAWQMLLATYLVPLMTFKDKPTVENDNLGPVNSRRLEETHIFERRLVFGLVTFRNQGSKRV
jgi:hypothetical protein